MPHADAQPRRDDVAHALGLVDDAEAAMRVELDVVKHRMPPAIGRIGPAMPAPRGTRRRGLTRAGASGDQKNPSASAW
ncbi:hypothetical protein WI38_07460 [Burkholderia ubonensis]|uniref:Uncharacterized protein n=1 Tax=Burkholderia ubonensis TaxID=101571 RepID=A0A117XU45_9BURK|nr:hypothetical protein WI35_21725 [Burkholderia ubonensis]KUZ94470.1 hypothetical protein WI38_07460 [Burkholderia ubonensis]KUZ96842.1 hypothetical protein WI39_10515 [Burkholderia ubonensis]